MEISCLFASIRFQKCRSVWLLGFVEIPFRERPSSHKLTRDPWLDLPPVGIGCQGGLRKIESTSEQLRSTLQQHTEDVSIPIGESPTYD